MTTMMVQQSPGIIVWELGKVTGEKLIKILVDCLKLGAS